MKILAASVVVLATVGIGYWIVSPDNSAGVQPIAANSKPLVEIAVPETLSAKAMVGKTAFDARCASCHGLNAVGQGGVAPPLVHRIYEPSHHGDEAFQRAAALGVRSHHWRFGDMPPAEGLTRADVTMIVAYVRELQQANGIN